MDWVDRPKNNYKGLYGILQLWQGSHLDNFSLKTLKLGWVAFHPRTFQLKCLDFQSNQYKKLAPVLSRFCNGLWKFDFFSLSFCRMQHRIPFFSALRLSVRRFQMPHEGLRFVKTLATFEIISATDSLIQNVTRIVCLR